MGSLLEHLRDVGIAGGESRQSDASTAVDPAVRSAEAFSFWLAVCLPLIHLPLLFTGLRTPLETAVFLELLSVNVLAFYFGRNYRT